MNLNITTFSWQISRTSMVFFPQLLTYTVCFCFDKTLFAINQKLDWWLIWHISNKFVEWWNGTCQHTIAAVFECSNVVILQGFNLKLHSQIWWKRNWMENPFFLCQNKDGWHGKGNENFKESSSYVKNKRKTFLVSQFLVLDKDNFTFWGWC